MDQARAELDRYFNRPIIAAIVCDDDFARDSIFADSRLRSPDAVGQGVSFVQTRNHHAEFDFMSVAAAVNRRTGHLDVNCIRLGIMLPEVAPEEIMPERAKDRPENRCQRLEAAGVCEIRSC